MGKMGHFKYLEHIERGKFRIKNKFSNSKRAENYFFLFRAISNKNGNAII